MINDAYTVPGGDDGVKRNSGVPALHGASQTAFVANARKDRRRGSRIFQTDYWSPSQSLHEQICRRHRQGTVGPGLENGSEKT